MPHLNVSATTGSVLDGEKQPTRAKGETDPWAKWTNHISEVAELLSVVILMSSNSIPAVLSLSWSKNKETWLYSWVALAAEELVPQILIEECFSVLEELVVQSHGAVAEAQVHARPPHLLMLHHLQLSSASVIVCEMGIITPTFNDWFWELNEITCVTWLAYGKNSENRN